MAQAMSAIKPGQVVPSVLDATKQLLHKCLSQLIRRPQVHAQQAARYLRGKEDSISSHSAVPLMSSLLIGSVKQLYLQQTSTSLDMGTGDAPIAGSHTPQHQILQYIQEDRSQMALTGDDSGGDAEQDPQLCSESFSLQTTAEVDFDNVEADSNNDPDDVDVDYDWDR